ncbi:pre-mRNA-splicing regulator female-lethal(2)D [Culicoides brevitarsis]|uniref:pre-mRNA-splicing regulator female-lethal(2)D n=1 Tax=Culicoides brevitarsis TaxID=469753 RepID=UPI00307BE77B
MSVEETSKETGENATQSSPTSATSSSAANPSNSSLPSDKTGKNVTDLETRCRLLEEEVAALKQSEATLKQQNVDAQRRERLLMRRLATKEQEMQDYMLQISEYKALQAPGTTALRNALLDPAVNVLFQKLKQELQATKAKLEETQNELSAWKFTPDSNTGKRLMAKCRLLYQENEELGKMTSNGRLAKLEADLACHKSLCDEVKKSQSEMDDFLQEIDEDVEGMQSTILFLQQELKAVRADNDRLKATYEPEHENDTGNATTTPLNGGNGETTALANNDNELTKPGSEQIVTKINLSRTQNGNINSSSVNNGSSVVENSNLPEEIDESAVVVAEKTNGDSLESPPPEPPTDSLKRGYDKTSENELVNPKRTRRTAAIETNKKLCSIDDKKVNNGIVNVSS